MMAVLEHRKIESVTVINLSGKITLGEAANSMLETVNDLLGRGERRMILNFEQVHYIDSSGLGVLVKCRNAAKSQQGQIKLLKLPKPIRDLMRITNLTSLFEITDDETAAVASFR